MSRLYRTLLKELKHISNTNYAVWKDELRNNFKQAKQLSIKEQKQKEKDAEDMITYLTSSRVHKELMERYWPISGLSEQEKLKRTANTVGFNLPKTFTE